MAQDHRTVPATGSDAAEPRALPLLHVRAARALRSAIEAPATGCGSGAGSPIFFSLPTTTGCSRPAASGPAQPLVGVIGTDDLFGAPVLAWADLRAAAGANLLAQQSRGLAAAQPRSSATTMSTRFGSRSPLVAQQQTGRPDQDPKLLVSPIVNKECSRCQWWEHCLPQLDPDDVSLRIDKAPLDMREIATLRRHGITTITDLVDAELDRASRVVSA